MKQRAAKALTALLYSAAAVGAVWLLAKYILPWTAPFLVAFGAAALMEPAVKRLCARGLGRSVAAGFLSLMVLSAVVAGAVWISSRGVSLVSGFAKQVPELAAAASDMLLRLEERLSSIVEAAPDEFKDYLYAVLESFGREFYQLPERISGWALGLLTKAAQSSPDILLFAVTAGIGTYFISASFPKTLAFVAAQLPESFCRKLEGMGKDLKASFGGWFKAQLILMVMTFFQLLAAFLLLKVKGAALLAGVTALVDAMPVFGTGIVLLPWAAYCLLLGDVGKGMGLVICWGLVNIVRNCVQAKLLGDQIGLDPLVSLLSIYMGWRIWGVWGMLLFPIMFVTLGQLNEKGVIRLWKNI